MPDSAWHEQGLSVCEGVLVALCELERWIFLKIDIRRVCGAVGGEGQLV